MNWKKSLILSFSIILVGIAVVLFVKNDAFIYQTPVGEIVQVDNAKPQKVEDNFGNPDQRQKQHLKVKLLNGNHKGENVTINNEFTRSQATDLKYRVHQKVLLHLNFRHGKIQQASITDLKRDVPITILLVVAIGLLLLMKTTGVRALLSLVLNALIFLVAVILDVHQNGFGILQIFSGTVLLFTAITLWLVLGWNKKMLATLLTTILGTFLALMIGLIVFRLTNNNGIHFETMEYVTQNPEPLFLAEILLGSLGAVMDEATDIIVSLAKLRQENPAISMHQLWLSGKNIGKTIMGPLLNVLFMIFMADTFSMMVLYLRNGNSWGYSFSMNMQLGFIQSLISGIGIVLTVPIASLMVGILFRKGAKFNV